MDDYPYWYKDAVFYQVHVRAFHDSTDDGNGDLRGLISKLDYLQWLGVNCLWLMPIYPSPLKDDGYDIADFCAIDPAIGTIEDFEALTTAAHNRGIRIIADLVVNHTSDKHAWFQEARRDPQSPKRDYYVWSDVDTGYPGVRIIFNDIEPSNWTWDPVARQYYWHRFFSHQPDLNYDNPAVQEEMLNIIRFWLDRGIDGFRVDAVPYLFEREGTACENLPETHAFIRRMREVVNERRPHAVLLAEANQWPADLARYFGDSDEFHMCFNFPLMPRMFMAIRREEAKPIIEIMQQLPAIPEACQWALFLRNHDELTLEMVTDEDRDYMFREYARDPKMRLNQGIRRRLSPLMENGRRQIELLYSLLFSLPGTPIIYYGDEIGMGDNVRLGDRNGCRTPMHWNGDRNAGFSRADPSQLFLPISHDPIYHYEAVNVEAQSRSQTSLLNWVRRVINVRQRFPAFGRGSLKFVDSGNPRVLAFLREYAGETILVVANLSRFWQPASVLSAEHAGRTPIELVGSNAFPTWTAERYPMTLSPHAAFWLRLRDPAATTAAGTS